VPDYLRAAISNGPASEQALIRRWWHEKQGARGHIVWEYYLSGCYLDAIWFPESDDHGSEYPGLSAPAKFPIAGAPVVLCEAKVRLNPELIGQALVYGTFARRAGADVRSIMVFAETAPPAIRLAGEDLGLEVVLP
jgi:hypothetical protein